MDTKEAYQLGEAHPRQSPEHEAHGGLVGVNKGHLTRWRSEQGEAAEEVRQDHEGTV